MSKNQENSGFFWIFCTLIRTGVEENRGDHTKKSLGAKPSKSDLGLGFRVGRLNVHGPDNSGGGGTGPARSDRLDYDREPAGCHRSGAARPVASTCTPVSLLTCRLTEPEVRAAGFAWSAGVVLGGDAMAGSGWRWSTVEQYRRPQLLSKVTIYAGLSRLAG